MLVRGVAVEETAHDAGTRAHSFYRAPRSRFARATALIMTYDS
jgi:hypothetical protein